MATKKRKSLIKIKKKPTKPVRRKRIEIDLGSICGDSLETVIDMAKGYDIGNCTIESYFSGGSSFFGYEVDCDSTCLVYEGEEPIFKYKERLADYDKKKAEYDSWLAKNKKLIVKEMKQRASEADKEKEMIAIKEVRAAKDKLKKAKSALDNLR